MPSYATHDSGYSMTSSPTLHILKHLIAFDTTSSKSNLALMSYIQSYLELHGVASKLIYNDEMTKANLFATIGPQEKPGVMLSGHTDTVPVLGQRWHRDPYQLSQKAGLVYGRGTADMKGFIAVVLAAVPQFVSQQLFAPVHLAFSFDEEIGCIGVRRLIETLTQHPIKPGVCIIGEPTSMKVVTAHKGKVAVRVTVHGKECHSGMAPRGVNAINYAAHLIIWLEQLASAKRDQGPYDQSYDIPYTTVHVGTISGGNALNIVPNLTAFDFEIRNIGIESADEILAHFKDYAENISTQMQKLDAGCAIEVNVIAQYPGLVTSDNKQAINFVRKLTASNDEASINFGTEGGLFNHALGVPTVVCGPGSMEQGHKPDEFIELEQLRQCELFMQRLVEQLRSRSVWDN